MSDYDVIVVGAGPAATSAAITLCQRGATTAVIAGQDLPTTVAGEVLSPEALKELELLGITDVLNASSVPCHGIETVWGRSTPTFHSYLVNPFGAGAVVDRSQFHSRLIKVAGVSGATVIRAQFLSAERRHQCWNVSIRYEGKFEKLCAGFLVDATGRSGAVVRSQGVGRRRFDKLCAVSRVLQHQTASQVIVVEAIGDGWWYLVPLPRERTLVCFLSDADIIRVRDAATPDGWLRLFQKTSSISSRIKSAESHKSSPLRCHPCESAILDFVAGDGWIAAGDAAVTFDPLSSIGVLRALRSGRELGSAVVSQYQLTAGSLKVWTDWEHKRFAKYLQLKRRQYLVEQRWYDRPFWRRRYEKPQQLNQSSMLV